MPQYHERPEGLAKAMAKLLIKYEKKFRKDIRKVSKIIPVFSETNLDKSIKKAKEYLERK